MKIWFFGDSWVAGCELARFKSNNELDFGKDEPSLAFPNIIQELTGIECINKGVSASSQPSMIEYFHSCNFNKGDIAIFALTSPGRRMYRSDDGSIADQGCTANKEFINQYDDERVSSQAIALLYYMSLSRGVTPYFFNLFDCVRFGDITYNEIPNENWLISNTSSIIDTLFDTEYFKRYDHHRDWNFQEWLETENELVQKYIRPCEAHPNLVGQRAIADFIIEKLCLS